jgi:hypothetical protein
VLAVQFPDLRPAQRRGLVLWVYGAVLAKSACEAAVVTALCGLGGWHTVRQYLRDWLRDGRDKACPCQTQVAVTACFAPLLRWICALWQGRELLLAIDVTTHQDRLTAIVVSVLYRSRALPVAWQILPGNQPGGFIAPLLDLLTTLAPAIPAGRRVVDVTEWCRLDVLAPRAMAAATRTGVKIECIEFDPPVNWLNTSSGRASARVTFTFPNGRSISSAIVIATAVVIPCPTSARGRAKEAVPSELTSIAIRFAVGIVESVSRSVRS